MKYRSIITTYMDWLDQCIKTVYLASLHTTLTEAYKSLSINPNNIKASLLYLLYENSNKLDSITEEELTDILNEEFIKAKILFIPISKSNLNIQVIPKYKETGLVYAETAKLIEIYVNDTFFNILKTAEIDNDDQNIKKLADDIYSLYTHEATHLNQKEKEKLPQTGIDPNTINTPTKLMQYLGSIREIASHARELANQLLLTEKTQKEIEILLTTRKGNDYLANTYQIYNLYWNIFGKATDLPKQIKDTDKDAQIRIHTFNKFKKYLTFFLQLDLKFFYHNNMKYTFG